MRFCPECLDSWLAFSFTPVPPWTAPPRCYIGSALSFQRSEQFRLCSERQRPLSVFCRDPLSVAGGEVGATVEVGDPPEVRSHRYETCQTLCRPFKFCYVSHTVFMPPSWGNHSPKSPPHPHFYVKPSSVCASTALLPTGCVSAQPLRLREAARALGGSCRHRRGDLHSPGVVGVRRDSSAGLGLS